MDVLFKYVHFFFLFDFDFLFHVYFFAFRVSKSILKEGQTLIGDNLDSESVLHLPLPFHGNKALVHEGGDVRVDVKGKFLYLQLVYQVVYLVFQGVCKEDGRFDGALTETGGACFVGSYIHGRSHTLAGDLHQSELAQGQYVVFCPVFLHVLAHAFV